MHEPETAKHCAKAALGVLREALREGGVRRGAAHVPRDEEHAQRPGRERPHHLHLHLQPPAPARPAAAGLQPERQRERLARVGLQVQRTVCCGVG